jgi:hypothetical protein
LTDYKKLERQHVLQQIQKNPDNDNIILKPLDAMCLCDGQKLDGIINHI